MGQSCGANNHSVALLGSIVPGRAEYDDGSDFGTRAHGSTPARTRISTPKEHPVKIVSTRFHISAEPGVNGESRTDARHQGGWRSFYNLGPMLGDGVSAKVYEAEAFTVIPARSSSNGEGVPAHANEGLSARGLLGRCGRMRTCLVERGRKVAIKRFHRLGSRTYKKELVALQRVGVHPHVLRLLESYEAIDGEDALVLEYCDGSTVYDLYAKEHANGGLPERMIVRIVYQLLLALQHLVSCGIEHQDIKPENLLLYDVSVPNQQVELKLGDFGWAALTQPQGVPPPKAPPSGAGSLWYAPPELNPPVPGCDLPDSLLSNGAKGALLPPLRAAATGVGPGSLQGRSDMWSVGVVTYLLLVGHNPFNAALRLHPSAIDEEVMRLVARGDFNRTSERWQRLPADARHFISVILQVSVAARMPVAEALNHVFVQRCIVGPQGASGPGGMAPGRPQPAPYSDRSQAWLLLDGFQQLAWFAIARAVSEPELDREVISVALGLARGSKTPPDHLPQETMYLWHLARELGCNPVTQWMQDRPSWAEVQRLAFSYLDIDCDGVLSQEDLTTHLLTGHPEERAVLWHLAGNWVLRWQEPAASPASITRTRRPGLSLPSFRKALMATREVDEDTAVFDDFGTNSPERQRGNASAGNRRTLPESLEEEIAWLGRRN